MTTRQSVGCENCYSLTENGLSSPNIILDRLSRYRNFGQANSSGGKNINDKLVSSMLKCQSRSFAPRLEKKDEIEILSPFSMNVLLLDCWTKIICLTNGFIHFKETGRTLEWQLSVKNSREILDNRMTTTTTTTTSKTNSFSNVKRDQLVIHRAGFIKPTAWVCYPSINHSFCTLLPQLFDYDRDDQFIFSY